MGGLLVQFRSPMERFHATIARMNTRTLPLIIVGLSLCAALPADDGSWNTSLRLSEGSLYAEKENGDIALENEILVFDGFGSSLTRAAFFFRNTASKDLTVQAGFPVRVHLGAIKDTLPGKGGKNAYFLSQNKYGGGVSGLEYVKAALGDALKLRGESGDDPELSDFYFDGKSIPGPREAPAKDLANLFSFSISQDGADVECPTVVIETSLTVDSDYGAQLDITFHFRHALSFTAASPSIVKVGYSADYKCGSSNNGFMSNDMYSYSYILGTGRTWKGQIGKLYLAIPWGMDPSLPGAFSRLARWEGKDVYLAQRYEPGESDMISIDHSGMDAAPIPEYLQYFWFDNPRAREAPTAPAQDFVKVRGASSNLKDPAPVYTAGGVIAKAPFGPLSLFDGIRETAWCEGVSGDGIGEWVEFELTKDVEALDIQNGYNMSFVKIEGKSIDTYYEKNNRPKTLEILSLDGKVKQTINLADTKELQSFDGIFLSRGRYRVYIRDVYKGSKWQDTCLGEITFVPASPAYSQFFQDDFIREHMSDLMGAK
jgi:hypothetical protein